MADCYLLWPGEKERGGERKDIRANEKIPSFFLIGLIM